MKFVNEKAKLSRETQKAVEFAKEAHLADSKSSSIEKGNMHYAVMWPSKSKRILAWRKRKGWLREDCAVMACGLSSELGFRGC